MMGKVSILFFGINIYIDRVKGTNMGYGTNMGSGLFSVSKKHYLPETIRNIQIEQKKAYSADSMTTVSFKGELSLFFKNVKYRINILGILVTKTWAHICTIYPTNNCIFCLQLLLSFSKNWRKNSTKFPSKCLKICTRQTFSKFLLFFITSVKLIIFKITPIFHNFHRINVEFPWSFHEILLSNINILKISTKSFKNFKNFLTISMMFFAVLPKFVEKSQTIYFHFSNIF